MEGFNLTIFYYCDEFQCKTGPQTADTSHQDDKDTYVSIYSTEHCTMPY